MSAQGPGDALSPLERHFSASDLVLYGAATWDWHRLHYDQAFASEMGLDAPIIDGQIYGALFAKQAMDEFGPKAFVRRLEFRMRNMAFAGDTLVARGEVTERRAEETREVLSLNQRLLRGETVIAQATTEVSLPARTICR